MLPILQGVRSFEFFLRWIYVAAVKFLEFLGFYEISGEHSLDFTGNSFNFGENSQIFSHLFFLQGISRDVSFLR